jgi:hypothetical protein
MCAAAWFRVLVALAALGLPAGLAQELWLETGVAYAEGAPQDYESAFKLGVRGLLPVSDTAHLFLNPYVAAGFGVDAGVLVRFRPNPTDPEGLTAHLGGTLSTVRGRFGVGLVGALSYAVSDVAHLAVVYTHRALLTPQLGQAFDVTLALIFRFE